MEKIKLFLRGREKLIYKNQYIYKAIYLKEIFCVRMCLQIIKH